MSHEGVVLSHLQGATTVWDSSGVFVPTLWAHSSHRRLLAIPIKPEAVSILPDEQVWMLAWMADCITAEIIGRTDEAWARTFDKPQDQLQPGDLQLMQEIDPEVRTALIVQSVRIDNGQMMCGIATSSLDDFGYRSWTPSIVRMIDHGMSDQLALSRHMVLQFEDNGSTMHSRQTHLATVFHDLGWDLSLC